MINDQARSHVVAAGRNTLIELTPEERQQWRAAMRPVWNRFAGDIGVELLAAAGAEDSPSQ
jgi:C4-dicarboxylate-binding protein DctP